MCLGGGGCLASAAAQAAERQQQPPGAARAEWEVAVDALSAASAAVDLPRVELLAPGLAAVGSGGVPVVAAATACLDDEGALWLAVDLPPGCRALLGLWVGPASPKLRVLAEAWPSQAPVDEEGSRGFRGTWSVREHAVNGMLRIGLALFFVVRPDDVPSASGRISLGEVLGEGCSGQVRAAVDLLAGRRDLAAKASAKPGCELPIEAWALQRLWDGHPADCPVGLFQDAGRELLVMPRLQRDLQSVKQDPSICPDGRFSAEAVVEVGVQVLAQLERLHAAGLAHGDLKPRNLMFEDGTAKTLRIVDFGTCRPFRLGTMRAVPRASAPAVGTTRFCSVPAHSGERSPRSDVENLAYVLIYLATGSLSWQGCCTAGSKRERAAQILEGKLDQDNFQRHLRGGLPANPALAEALCDVVQWCRRWDRDASPDYGRVREALRAAVPGAARQVEYNGCVTPSSLGLQSVKNFVAA